MRKNKKARKKKQRYTAPKILKTSHEEELLRDHSAQAAYTWQVYEDSATS